MCKITMRIRLTESRARRYEALCEATNESTKSKAIDRAVGYYLRMRGNTDAYPRGALEQLLAKAEQNESLTGDEISSVLNCSELPLDYHTETVWSVGNE